MIILDTNVISETQKQHPDSNVMLFLDRLDPTTTFITSINVSEVLYGIDILPDGQRKKSLEDAAFRLFQETFKGQILPFDFDASSHHAINAAHAKRSGRAVSLADGMIAGIARSKMATVATRDVSPFKAMGVEVINPWEPDKPEEWGFS